MKRVDVQDDRREKLITSLCGLMECPDGRNGTDAMDENGELYELKSTGTKDIPFPKRTTLNTIQRYKNLHWLVSRGDNYDTGYVIRELYYLPPIRMQPFLGSLEDQISKHLQVWDFIVDKSKVDRLSVESRKYYDRFYMQIASLNSPWMKWSYVQKNGVELFEPYDASLREARNEFRDTGTVSRYSTVDLFSL